MKYMPAERNAQSQITNANPTFIKASTTLFTICSLAAKIKGTTNSNGREMNPSQ
jgi:hypothetical protein